MSLTISKFLTRCHVPTQHQAVGALATQIVRQRFASECSQRLSLLPAQQSVIRIRSLPLQVKITAEKLDEETITRTWVDAFIRELLIALNKNHFPESQIVRAETRAHWIVRFTSDVLAGSAGGRWEYEEFQDDLKLTAAECFLSVLAREPWEIVSVLLLLDEQSRLDQLLFLFDELALERLFQLLASYAQQVSTEPTIDDLLSISALVISQPLTRGILATRQRALRLFITLKRTGEFDNSTRMLTPRLVFNTLMTLDALVELTQSLPPETWFSVLSPETLARRPGPALHSVVLEVIAKVWTMLAESRPERGVGKLAALSHRLVQLRPVPPATTSGDEKSVSRWLTSDHAGLLLLVGLIERLGWVQRIRISSIAQRLDTPAINFCLAAIALRILGQSAEEKFDPAVLLFAGWSQPEFADITAFRNFLVALSETEQTDLVDLLIENKEAGKPAYANWTETFDYIAKNLIEEFAARVRGFRKANPSYVVKTFFSQPGRVFIDEKRILVVLQPNAFHIALHISSMDESVESVTWLGGRRLEFQLEGL